MNYTELTDRFWRPDEERPFTTPPVCIGPPNMLAPGKKQINLLLLSTSAYICNTNP